MKTLLNSNYYSIYNSFRQSSNIRYPVMALFLRDNKLPTLTRPRFQQSIVGYVRRQHTVAHFSGNSWITPLRQRARCAVMYVLSFIKRIVKFWHTNDGKVWLISRNTQSYFPALAALLCWPLGAKTVIDYTRGVRKATKGDSKRITRD